MQNQNLQEQYALLENEKREDRKKTIIIIILCILILLVTLLGLYFAYSKSGKECTLNCDTNGDGVIDTNIDTDGDGKCDINCIVKGKDGNEYLINIDYKGDKIPHFNLDIDNDGIPDTNLVDKDIDGDGKPDLNIDIDGDGKPDINIDLDNSNLCDLNCDTDGDKKPDINIDSNGDGKPDLNIDIDGDGKPDINIDTNGDGKCNINCDTNNDGKPDVNIDIDNDNKCDFNCDTNGDGNPDDNLIDQKDENGQCALNCDTNNDGIPDTNLDIDGDGKPDINIDSDNDGVCDLNCDTNGDGKPDTNVDTDGDGVCDSNCELAFRNNADLESLSIKNYLLTPNFRPNITEYSIKVDSSLTQVVLSGKSVNPNSKINGLGVINLTGTSTRVSVVVVAPAGTVKTYYITINKDAEPPIIDNEGDGNIDVDTDPGKYLIVSYTKDIKVSGIIPGWNGSQSFKLTNKSNKTMVYTINLIDVVNTFKSDDFKYSLTKDNRVIVPQTPALRSNGPIYENLIIGPGETAEFKLDFEFVNQDYPQNEDAEVEYKSKVEILIKSVK